MLRAIVPLLSLAIATAYAPTASAGKPKPAPKIMSDPMQEAIDDANAWNAYERIGGVTVETELMNRYLKRHHLFTRVNNPEVTPEKAQGAGGICAEGDNMTKTLIARIAEANKVSSPAVDQHRGFDAKDISNGVCSPSTNLTSNIQAAVASFNHAKAPQPEAKDGAFSCSDIDSGDAFVTMVGETPVVVQADKDVKPDGWTISANGSQLTLGNRTLIICDIHSLKNGDIAVYAQSRVQTDRRSGIEMRLALKSSKLVTVGTTAIPDIEQFLYPEEQIGN